MSQSEIRRSIEITGQVWGVQLSLPGKGEGGTFQILLENGHIVASPYPRAWHLEIASALQANDVVLLKVKGIGEHSPDGELLRIVEPGSITRCWAPAPNRLFDTDAPAWETVVAIGGETAFAPIRQRGSQ